MGWSDRPPVHHLRLTSSSALIAAAVPHRPASRENTRLAPCASRGRTVKPPRVEIRPTYQGTCPKRPAVGNCPVGMTGLRTSRFTRRYSFPCRSALVWTRDYWIAYIADCRSPAHPRKRQLRRDQTTRKRERKWLLQPRLQACLGGKNPPRTNGTPISPPGWVGRWMLLISPSSC